MLRTFNLLLFLFRNRYAQDTVFEFCLNLLFPDLLAKIEGSAQSTCITFLADVFAFLIFLVLIKTFLVTDGQITILQFDLDLIFLLNPGRSISSSYVFLSPLTSAHQSGYILTIHRILLFCKELLIKREHIIK